MPLRALLAAVVAAALIAAPARSEAYAAPQKPRAGKVRLKGFDSCAGLVRYARRNSLRNAQFVSGGGQDDEGAGGGEPASDGGEDFSGTNTQEAGVDEPDILKSDGAHAFAIAGSALHSVDVRAATPVVRDSLSLVEDASHTLLLHGDRALVISSLYSGSEALGLPEWVSSTRLIEVDVSDPARLRRISTLDAEGSYLSARLTGETARIVLRATPRALNGSMSAVRRARLAKWMPRGVLTRRPSGAKRTRRLVACDAVRRTASFTGADMITVLTVDLERGLPAVDSDALMTDADTVYASTGSLYVATQRWFGPQDDDEPPKGVTTAIHRFDASVRGTTAYASSGEVRGFLLSQWALSEHAGHLRVATTTVPSWWDEGEDSESFVTVLREDGGRLDRVGRVGGLGRGEQIFAVRFIGDTGYVVTFRQVDPLYTVDLSTPTAPEVLGELKIRGYSAYLHPIGEDLLIGVGQDATAQGRQLGTQLSLFDVSDPRNPQRLHQLTLPEGSSEVEYDHLAFLHWPATGLVVLPLQRWTEDEEFAGAAGFRVDRSGIVDLGRLSHPVKDEWRGQVRRSLVVGDRVFTLSHVGMLASPIDTFSGGSWLRFPR
jgi:Beta propeller domain